MGLKKGIAICMSISVLCGILVPESVWADGGNSVYDAASVGQSEIKYEQGEITASEPKKEKVDHQSLVDHNLEVTGGETERTEPKPESQEPDFESNATNDETTIENVLNQEVRSLGNSVAPAYGEATIDVTSFGANGSDSKVDTKAIQKALKAVRDAGGGTVYIPAGKYYIDKSLIIYSNTTLNLDPKAEIIRKNKSLPMIRNYTGSMGTALKEKTYNQTARITINGGIWNGNVSGKVSSQGEDIMRIYCATDVKVTNCTIKGVCGFHHINFASVDGVTVQNVKFTGFVYYSKTDYSSLETGKGNQNEWNKSASITSEALQFDHYENKKYPCKNIIVSDCVFENVLSGVGNHHWTGSAVEVKITGNTFKNVANTCVNLYNFNGAEVSGNSATDVRSFARVYGGMNCKISNNQIKAKTKKNKYNMFRVSDQADLIIENNTIEGSGNSVIKLDAGSMAIIRNNKINKASYNAISVNQSLATIKGNTIKKAGNMGIYFAKGKGIISDNWIFDSKLRGIGIQNKSNVTEINHNIIEGGKEQGIYVSKASKVRFIRKNILKENGTDSIRVKDAEVKIIGGSIADRNTIMKSGASGIFISSSKVSDISCNVVTNAAKKSGAASIRLNQLKNKVSVENNTLVGSKRYGIHVVDCKTDIKSNTINNAASTAIYMSKGSGSIRKNQITGTKKGSGVYVEGKARLSKVSENTINRPKTNGIYIKGASATAVSKNKIVQPGSNGIDLAKATVQNISSNTITSSQKEGIYIRDHSKVTDVGGSKKRKNMVTSARWNGIVIQMSSVSSISYNEVSGSKRANISIKNVNTTTTIQKNTLYYASGQGIKISSSKVKILENIVNESGTCGIYLEGSKSNAVIKKNRIDRVINGNGIRICNGTASVSDNSVKNTKIQGIYIAKD